MRCQSVPKREHKCFQLRLRPLTGRCHGVQVTTDCQRGVELDRRSCPRFQTPLTNALTKLDLFSCRCFSLKFDTFDRTCISQRFQKPLTSRKHELHHRARLSHCPREPPPPRHLSYRCWLCIGRWTLGKGLREAYQSHDAGYQGELIASPKTERGKETARTGCEGNGNPHSPA
jgi:hypothetical protein